METKEQIRNLHNSLVRNAVNFYRQHGTQEGLGEKHFDLILKSLFDKFILAVFFTDFAEAKAAKEDLANMLGLQSTCDFMNRIDALRRSNPVENSVKAPVETLAQVPQKESVKTSKGVHIRADVKIGPCASPVKPHFAIREDRPTPEELLTKMSQFFTTQDWLTLLCTSETSMTMAYEYLAYLIDLGLIKRIYRGHYKKL